MSLGLFRMAWGRTGGPSGRRINLGTRGFTPALFNVAVFIGVRVGSLGRAYGSPG